GGIERRATIGVADGVLVVDRQEVARRTSNRAPWGTRPRPPGRFVVFLRGQLRSSAFYRHVRIPYCEPTPPYKVGERRGAVVCEVTPSEQCQSLFTRQARRREHPFVE